MKTMKHMIRAAVVGAVALLGACTEKPIAPTELVLDETELKLTVGESAQLTGSLLPENSEQAVITWSTSDGGVATVSGDGTVQAVAKGECTIIARAAGLSAECKVSVVGKKVETVRISPDRLDLTVGQTATLTAEVLPEDADDRAVVWTSSDENIATVSYLGEVKAIAPGTVSVKAAAGGQEAVCEVTVSGIPVESITLSQTTLQLNIGNTVRLTATVLPENATDKSLVWSSSEQDIVTVDNEGNVTAVAEGNAVITARNGEVSATCEVSVVSDRLPAIGDFYYSDGTWDSELDPEKKVIGVVFWTGDPRATDAALAKEHPECSHGLVVSLGGEETPAWQPNHKAFGRTVGSWVEENTEYASPTTGTGDGEPFNFINGYNNTKACEAFNEANPDYKVTAIDPVQTYRKTVPAPESSSDWYLPSSKELSLMCAGDCEGGIWYHRNTEMAKKINEKLALVSGQQFSTSLYYWTSSEITALEAAVLYFGVGYLDICPKEYHTYCVVRPILAF